MQLVTCGATPSRKLEFGSHAQAAPFRLLTLFSVLLLVVCGWIVLLVAHDAQWRRLPDETADRFAADTVDVPLPALPPLRSLVPICRRPPPAWRFWRDAWLRNVVAHCLAEPSARVQGPQAEALATIWTAQVQQRVQAAKAWISAYDAQVDTRRGALRWQLQSLRAKPTLALQPVVDLGRHVARPVVDVRQMVGPKEPALGVARAMRARVRATEERLARIESWPADERVAELALTVGGLQLSQDVGTVPPEPLLNVDRQSLSDVLAWQHRAQGFVQRGFDLANLRDVLPAIAVSSVVALLLGLVIFVRRPLLLLLWGGAGWMLGVGALLLIDIALTGDAAVRYLAERQFVHFAVGTRSVVLLLPVPGLPAVSVWWPLLAAAGVMLLLARIRPSATRLLAPLQAWIDLAAHSGRGLHRGLWPLAVLLVAGVASVLWLGLPASVSEVLMLLGVIGLATCLASLAPLANAGAGPQRVHLGIVATALACALGGSLWRGDLGHALVALVVGAVFAWLLGGRMLQALVAAASAALLAALAACLWQGELVGPLAWLADHLPAHAQDRLQAQFDPFHAAASDLARVRWLIDSAGASGWGPGYVPWLGLADAGAGDGLPLQGPSDYVLGLLAALWGPAGGLAILSGGLLVFVGAAGVALAAALRAGTPAPLRLLGAVGGFGCLVMAVKVVLSAGGVSGVLPLTGLPVAMVGYGPASLLAALGYLVLALGAAAQHKRPAGSQAVRIDTPRVALPGAARRQGRWLLGAGSMALLAWAAIAAAHLMRPAGALPAVHQSRQRLELAQALARSLVPATADTTALPLEAADDCVPVTQAVALWNQRLARLSQPVRPPSPETEPSAASAGKPATRAAAHAGVPTLGLRLDPALLRRHLPLGADVQCQRLARMLGQMVETDLPRLVGSAALRPNGPGAGGTTRLAAFEPARRVAARAPDYTTPNAWWGQPGCLAVAGSGAPSAPCPPTAAAMSLLADPWLQRELAPQLALAVRQPAGFTLVNQRAVASGPRLSLTLDPVLQPLAQQVADCFVGQRRGVDCQAALPADPAWRAQHFQAPEALRAGALGLVLVEVDSGRIAALAGAVSECVLQQLSRPASADARGRLPALRPGQRCAQWPDQRSSFLALQHPALWLLPPGSSIKPLAVAAGIDAGLVPERDDVAWKSILAESQQRLPVQRLALQAGPRYLQVLQHAGWGEPVRDLLWGNTGAPAATRWAMPLQAGTQGLRVPAMGLDEAERIRAQNLSPAQAQRRYGGAVMADYLAARRLADAALGGADMRISVLALAQDWAALDRRARGHAHLTPPHLLEAAGQPQPLQAVDWVSPAAARRVLQITRGVTASAWKGTAQGSCRVVFGACPAEGWPGLSGKTGTSDFLVAEDAPWVKPGQQLPAKLFGGVFSAADGRRYAVAAMALRVRQAGADTLELTPSAPAEAALTLVRQMGRREAP